MTSKIIIKRAEDKDRIVHTFLTIDGKIIPYSSVKLGYSQELNITLAAHLYATDTNIYILNSNNELELK